MPCSLVLSTLAALSLAPNGVDRRTAVATAAASAAAILPVATATAASLDSVYDTRGLDMAPVLDPSKFRKLDCGARVADVKVGTGPEVAPGSRVSLQWILRRSNGYFVDSSLGLLSAGPGGGVLNLGAESSATQFDPFIFTVGDGRAIVGVDEGVRGMRQGGTRRLVIPIKAGYTTPVDKSAGPLPSGFGPRRQIERELAKQDPYNYFFLEVEAQRVSS